MRGCFTIIGDCNIDIFTSLESGSLDDLVRLPLVYLPWERRPGGALCNVARAARRHFDEVRVIGSVGEDCFGDWIRSDLKASAETQYVVRRSDYPTGIVIAIRDAARMEPIRRTLLVESASAGKVLLEEDILPDVIASSNYLYIDGYLLFSERARNGCLKAIKIARTANVTTIVDVVPHTLWRSHIARDVLSVLSDVDIVISWAGTIGKLLAVPVNYDCVNELDAIHTYQSVREVLPTGQFALRFGEGGVEFTLLGGDPHKGSFVIRRNKEHVSTEVVGWGDELSIQEICFFLENGA
jgi:sugar/nucleoside kinase (ribokinase family)